MTGLTGMKRHATAIEEPVKAIQTTDTAGRHRGGEGAKCNLASRKPKAELFIEVSIAIVLDDFAESQRARAPVADDATYEMQEHHR